jgi:hypothetical protein
VVIHTNRSTIVHTSVNTSSDTIVNTSVCMMGSMSVNTSTRPARHTVPVPRKPMKPRQVRVRDDVWDEAMATADARDEVLSEEIRKFLERYIRDHKRSRGR